MRPGEEVVAAIITVVLTVATEVTAAVIMGAAEKSLRLIGKVQEMPDYRSFPSPPILTAATARRHGDLEKTVRQVLVLTGAVRAGQILVVVAAVAARMMALVGVAAKVWMGECRPYLLHLIY